MSAFEQDNHPMTEQFDNDNNDDIYGGFDEDEPQQEETKAVARPSSSGKKGVKKTVGKGKKSNKREEDRRYHRFITKVFKTIHPDMQIHPDTVNVINTAIYDILGQVCEEAATMINRTNKKTMSSTDLQFAIKTLFPHELAKHAEMEGIMAVARAEGMQQEGQNALGH